MEEVGVLQLLPPARCALVQVDVRVSELLARLDVLQCPHHKLRRAARRVRDSCGEAEVVHAVGIARVVHERGQWEQAQADGHAAELRDPMRIALDDEQQLRCVRTGDGQIVLFQDCRRCIKPARTSVLFEHSHQNATFLSFPLPIATPALTNQIAHLLDSELDVHRMVGGMRLQRHDSLERAQVSPQRH
jgi:hypothetical protein